MSAEQGPSDSEARRPAREVMVLTELDQIKILADPLRIRILEQLAEERTTKQVAERLGEKPTKLYHHVDALERVGLIELTRTRQNRGTLEKYYLAVARAFRADAQAFSGDECPDDEKETLRSIVSTIMDSTTSEMMALIDSDQGTAALEEEGLLSFMEIHGTREEVAEIRNRFLGIVQELVERSGAMTEEGPERHRLTIASFRLLPEGDAD